MKLVWDKTGERKFETGIEKVVLYPMTSEGTYPKGVAWNGCTAVNEKPSGAEASPFYADNIQYLNIMSNEKFGASLEAYTYPDEFEACDGSAEIAPGVVAGMQKRSAFGLSYVSRIGNDIDGVDYGYKIHLVYGALASPSEKAYNSINESVEAGTMSWELSTTPVEVPGLKPTAIITINSTKVKKEELAALENILYGSEDTEARLPLPTELVTMFSTPVAG